MVLEVLIRAMRPEKERNDIQTGKKEIKLSLHRQHDRKCRKLKILHARKKKDIRTSKLSKVAMYKINTQKNQLYFPYINNK